MKVRKRGVGWVGDGMKQELGIWYREEVLLLISWHEKFHPFPPDQAPSC